VDPDTGSLRKHRSIALRVCGDGTALPFARDQFDLVTANMVVEHLPAPERQFREICRVLKPGGKFALHTPNANGYSTLMARAVPDAVRSLAALVLEKRGNDDRFRTFYRANTRGAIDRLARIAGFTVERLELVRSVAMFAMIAPLAAVELLLLRALASRRLGWLRPNLIAVLTKQVS
jgi:SAM-dependent methyltransferase